MEKFGESHPDVFVTAAFVGKGLEDITARLEPEIPVLTLGVNDMQSILNSVKLLQGFLVRKKRPGSIMPSVTLYGHHRK